MDYKIETMSPGNSEGSGSEGTKRLRIGDTHCTASPTESSLGQGHWSWSEPMGSSPVLSPVSCRALPRTFHVSEPPVSCGQQGGVRGHFNFPVNILLCYNSKSVEHKIPNSEWVGAFCFLLGSPE